MRLFNYSLSQRLVGALIILLTGFVSQQAYAQCAGLIDLNTWSRQGPAANGTWTVNAAGTQVTQGINGLPTFFVSPQEYINVRITGTISTSGGDDDFIGFVFGYQDPVNQPGPNYDCDFYLFDWKQGNQGAGLEGRSFVRVDTTFNLGNNGAITNYFWGHQDAPPGFDVIDSLWNTTAGWNQNVNYNFELIYLADRATILINGDTFFDVPGCYQPGRFGFYNYSQAPVVYSNFAYELIPDFNFASQTVCLNDSAQLFYTIDTCSNQAVSNTEIASWEWDFGDGTTDSVQNPTHLYGATGTYTVQLIVTDSVGCTDSVSQPINILPVPGTPSANNNGPICEGAALNLTSSPAAGLNFVWSGPNGFTANTQNPSINPTVAADSGNYVVTVNNGVCTSDPDSTLAIIYSTPIAPVATSNSPVCEDSALNFSVTAVPGATYTWSGPNGFAATGATASIANPTTAASGSYTVFAAINGCPGPASTVNVTVNPTPVVTITGDSVICAGETTTLTANGASTYSWSNGPATASNTVAPAVSTVYSVIGTSTAGCPSLPVATGVTINALPIVNLGADTTVCDSLTLDAGPGFLSYEWNNGVLATQTWTVLATNSYFVEVMNTDSCIGYDTIQVTVNPTPTALITGDNTICPGGSTVLFANGGTSYNWNTGASSPTITVAPAADSTYVLTATTNGCTSAPDSFLVTVGSPALANLGPDFSVCDDTILSPGSGFSDYDWNTGDTTFQILINTSGTYSVTVMNQDSCFDSDTVNVTVFNTQLVDIGADQIVCPGSTATFMAAPATFASYIWNNNTTAATNQTSQTGPVILSTIDNNGCPDADTALLTNFPVLLGDLGPDRFLCEDSTLILDASGWNGASYTWTPGGQTSPTIAVTQSGTYGVTIDDGNGCLYSDDITITIDVPPTMTLTPSDVAACDGYPMQFTASPGGLSLYSYSIDGNLISSTASDVFGTIALQNGSVVTVVGTTIAGCPTDPATAAPVTILPEPSGTVNVPFVCSGEISDLSIINPNQSGLTYSWSGGGGLTGTGSSIQYQYPSHGNFGVLVTLDNGYCTNNVGGTAEVGLRPESPTVFDVEICEGIDFDVRAGGNGTLNWYDDADGINLVHTGSVLNFTNTSAGVDTLYVESFSNGCGSVLSPVLIDIGVVPVADFISSPDTGAELNIPDAAVSFVNLSSNADGYTWIFGDGGFSSEFQPVHVFTETGEYNISLIARTNAECADTIVRGPYNIINLHNVFVPNAFTPNGDQLNDYLEIVVFGVERYDLEIFDRWGKLVFQNNGDPGTYWYGTYNGTNPMPEGVYVYKLVYDDPQNPEGENIVLSGTVTLMR